MQGLFIRGNRPASKKAVKDFLANGGDPGSIWIEAPSMFGNEYDGPVDQAPNGSYTFVGPDPYTKRSFYGTLTVSNGTYKVS